MTNWQLYISAGLPTATGLVTIAIAFILNGRIEARLDAFRADVDTRFDAMRTEINTLRLEMGDRIDALRTEMEGKLTGLRSELIARIDRVSDGQKQFYMILGEHKGKIESLEKR